MPDPPFHSRVPTDRWSRQLRRRLLEWFDRGARDLPWRRTRDPYAIWVSEIMLQQTQVATVIPYFERFLQAFPDVASLARAPEEAVLRLWEGLGYYRRARQLHQAAALVVVRHGGRFPRDLAAARALPGVGRYTAGAVLSIAFDDPQPILEANTMRVWSRLLAYRGDPRSAEGQRFLWDCAAAIVPPRRAGSLNQALMELGSEVCAARIPACDRCPVAKLCVGRQKGWQRAIPPPPRKARYENVREAALVVWRNRRVLLRQCQPNERWAGLWDFPRFAVSGKELAGHASQLLDELQATTGVRAIMEDHIATMRYGVTRFRVTLACYRVRWSGGRVAHGHLRWITPSVLPRVPLSVTGRKICRLLTDHRDSGLRETGPPVG